MLKVYLTFYKFLWRYKFRFMAYVLVVFVYSASQTVQPFFYKLFVDNIGGKNYQTLIGILMVFIGVRALGVAGDVFNEMLGDWVIFDTARDIRMAVFKKVAELDFAYHLSKSTGSLISAFKRGDGSVFDLNHSINNRLLQILFSFLIMTGFLLKMDPLIALVVVISFAANLLMTRVLIKNNIRTRAAFNDAEDEVSGIITDNLINFETVKLFAKEEWEYNRLGNSFKDWRVKLWKYANSFRVIDIWVGVVGNMGIFSVLFLGLKMVDNLTMTAGDYVMLFGFILSFYPRFFELIYEIRNMAKHFVDLQKYFEVLNMEVEVKDPVKPTKLESVHGEINFEKVSFTYPEGKKNTISDFSLKIREGQSIAFVGSSGVGKTTIVKLLMRFYDPNKGNISIDGIDIKNFTKSKLRSFMGVVPQEPVLFNNTISFNIAYGAKNKSMEAVISAAKMANLHDFIMSMPKKYETEVGERGIKLSGGQKQRLAIARMILSDPDIIIFDEATSQLDSESEKLIQDAFWKAAANKTTLIIAHRLSTIARADRIIVMEKGKIAESGSHRELLSSQNGLYKRFWSLQAKS